MNQLKLFLATVAALFALSQAYAGPGGSGGGNAIAAQFIEVTQRAGEEIESLCQAARAANTSDAETIHACSHGIFWGNGIFPMIVLPRSRNSIKNLFGVPYDAKLKAGVVLLDVDRWSDLENETDPAKIPAARKAQVTLALHMAMVLIEKESENSHTISGELVAFLIKNKVSLEDVVGEPVGADSILPMTSAQGKISGSIDPVAIATQFYAVAQHAYNEIMSICAQKQNGFSANGSKIYDPNFAACYFTASPSFRVVPRGRDSILGSDRKPRDAGNDGYATVFLDTDRWLDVQNETDPSKILAARTKQVSLAIHETLVLGHQESNDTYLATAQMVDLLLKNHVSFVDLVGEPKALSAN